MRCSREVDHHADVWISKRTSDIAKSRRWLVTTEKHHTRQALQGRIVPLRIDDAEAVALQDKLLAKQAGNPGLARTRIASHQNDAAMNRYFEWASFRCLPQEYATTIHSVRRQASEFNNAADVFGDRSRASLRQDLVSNCEQSLAAITHDNTNFACV